MRSPREKWRAASPEPAEEVKPDALAAVVSRHPAAERTNWAVYPLPGAGAFYTAAQEHYQPLGDGRTVVNCSYLERWDADLKKVRFAEPKVALFGGASDYREGKAPLNIFPEN